MISKKIVSLAMGTVLCSAGLFGIASTPGSASPEGAWIPAAAEGARDFLFGLRIAGTYVSDVQGQGFPDLQTLGTLSADGTFSASESNDVETGDLETAVHGTWKRTGFRTTQHSQLQMNFDADGVLEFWLRSDFELSFAPDLQSATFEGATDLFLATQDPLDPDAVPIAVFPFSGSNRRLNVRL